MSSSKDIAQVMISNVFFSSRTKFFPTRCDRLHNQSVL